MVMKYPSPRRRRSIARESPATQAPETAPGGSREISAGEFKARCLALMDEVRDRGGEYVITKRGTPVARLVPVRMERRPLLGSMKGTVKVLGDIVSPLDEPWDALDGWDDDASGAEDYAMQGSSTPLTAALQFRQDLQPVGRRASS
jgi:prevent-host-death family protein